MRLPSFQFYPRDWRGHVGVQSLSFHDRGVWFEMICLMHDSEQRGKMILNGRPMTDDQIARSLGLDNQILTTTLTTLLTSGVATRCTETGAVCSKRMVDDEKLRQIRTKAGKMGGNPALLNQNPTTQVNQNPTPTAHARTADVDVNEESLQSSGWKGTGEGVQPVNAKVRARCSLLELTDYLSGPHGGGYPAEAATHVFDTFEASGWTWGKRDHIPNWQAAARKVASQWRENQNSHRYGYNGKPRGPSGHEVDHSIPMPGINNLTFDNP